MLFHLSPVPRSSAHPTVHLQKNRWAYSRRHHPLHKTPSGATASKIHHPFSKHVQGQWPSAKRRWFFGRCRQLCIWEIDLFCTMHVIPIGIQIGDLSLCKKKGEGWNMQFSMLKSRKWDGEDMWRWWTCCGNDFQNVVTFWCCFDSKLSSLWEVQVALSVRFRYIW